MPLYEYECDACRQRFEIIQKRFSDPVPDVCPKCGKGPVQRLMSSPAIQFKGSGFYITDYASKGKTDAAAAEKSGSATTSASSTKTDTTKQTDSAGTDSASKPATASAPASESASTPSAKKD